MEGGGGRMTKPDSFFSMYLYASLEPDFSQFTLRLRGGGKNLKKVCGLRPATDRNRRLDRRVIQEE